MGREQIFKNTFQGIFSDQKICKDCPHRWAPVLLHYQMLTLFSFTCLTVCVCGRILSQIWAWRNLHGVEPWSDFLSEFGDLFRPVCQRRGARGQQRLLLWKMQGEGLYTATHAFIMLHVKPFILEACISVSSVQRTTVKRTCIKSLPSVLCIHLMRFGFDWESGRSIKYDEQIRVCWKFFTLKLYSSMWWYIFFIFLQHCKSLTWI